MATRKNENVTPGFGPAKPKPVQTAPDAPSAEKLKAKAKELKGRPKGIKKAPKQSQEELTKEIQLAEHFALAEEMARDTVDILDVGMSHVDDMYEFERDWVLKKRHEKLTFTFNKKEAETVGNACWTLYKRVDPAKLAAWGGFMTAAALIGTVLIPRMKMASELSQLRKDLEDQAKNQLAAQAAVDARPASTSRVPSQPAPAAAVAGVPRRGADGKISNVNPTAKD